MNPTLNCHLHTGRLSVGVKKRLTELVTVILAPSVIQSIHDVEVEHLLIRDVDHFNLGPQR